MLVMNTDVISYQSKIPEEVLETADHNKKKRTKKKNYLNEFINERRHFTPFVGSMDCLLGFKAEATLKRIAIHLTQKWKELYSLTCEYVNSRVAIILDGPPTAASGGAGFRCPVSA